MSRPRQLRVLLVCHRYPPIGIAGVERISAQTAEELARRGHEVTVLTRRDDSSPTLSLERRTEAGVQIVTIAGGGSQFERFPVHEPALELILERMLAEVTPDVVLATHLLHHSPGYVAVAHRWGIPVVLELHDFFMLCPRVHLQRKSGELCSGPEAGRACAVHCFGDQRDPLLRWALRSQSFAEAMRTADVVLAPSRYVAERMTPLRGDGAPIEVVGNAVSDFGRPARRQRDPAAPLHLASIGVTVAHKGFGVVVEAARLSGVPARYTIFGLALEPGMGKLLEEADEAPNLELSLYGSFEPSHLPVLLAEVDALVVPSVVPETFSIVVREAFACGIPVIASRIGALPEAVRPEENGWLFAPGDSVGLAALLQRLEADRSLLGRAAAGIRPDDVTTVAARASRIEGLLHAARAGARRNRRPRHEPELAMMREALVTAE